MPAAALATVPALEVVPFGKYHQPLLVEVKIFVFDQRLLDGSTWFVNHLK